MDLLSSLTGSSSHDGTSGNIQIDQQKANAMNLSYLQRLDAGVESIVATAGHVALYDFDPGTKAWSRKDVEGSLFLVRTRDGRFRFVILNKKGDSGDYWEDFGEGFSCEKQEPYVMYKQQSRGGQVVGIWFYEEQDCGRFARLFEEISSGTILGGNKDMGTPASGQALLGMLKVGGVGGGVPPGVLSPGVPPPGMSGMPPPQQPMMQDARRAQALLESLGRNEMFCRILGDEMRRAGWN